jgi:hypothetical protein
MRNVNLLIALSLSSCLSLRCQPGDNNIIKIKSTKDFSVGSEQNAALWDAAAWINLSKSEGPVSYTTRVKMLYSEKGIYTLFDCVDEKITASKQDDFSDLWKEDVIEIFLWTDESAPLYFEYELSPLNKELAILVPNFNGEFLGWKPWQYEGERKTRHEVTIRKENGKVTAWTGEVFIPYTLLKPLQNVPPTKGTQWRVNMYRIDYDGNKPSEWVWRPVKTNFHEYKSFGKMIFD